MRKLHKWIALIAGVQVGLWLISGLMMSVLDSRAVSGAGSAAFEHDVELLPANADIVEPEVLRQRHASAPVVSIELKRLLGQWVWRLQTESQVALHDAFTGELVQIDAAQARQIANNGYAGDSALRSATLLLEPTLEARGHPPPLWRVDFEDVQHTRYYISVNEGRILERRTDAWRLFDFFWMLHTMDYAGRDDFNTPWVIAFAFLAMWLAVSGVVLLCKSFARTSKPYT